MGLVQDVKKLVDDGMSISEAYKVVKQIESAKNPVKKPSFNGGKGRKIT